MQLIVLVGDEALVDAHFSLFGDSANLDANRCTVCAEYTTGSKSFWMHLMELLGDVGLVECHFGPFGRT
jgi:hypothetical protein